MRVKKSKREKFDNGVSGISESMCAGAHVTFRVLYMMHLVGRMAGAACGAISDKWVDSWIKVVPQTHLVI